MNDVVCIVFFEFLPLFVFLFLKGDPDGVAGGLVSWQPASAVYMCAILLLGPHDGRTFRL